MYQQRGELDKARDEIARVLASPLEAAGDAPVIVLAADLLARQGRADEAEQELRKLDGLELPSGSRELAKAEYFARHDRADEAIALIRAATAVDAKNALLWGALVRYQLACGRSAVALASLDAGLAAVPADPALAALGQQRNLLAAAQDPSLRALVIALVADPLANAGAGEALKAAWEE